MTHKRLNSRRFFILTSALSVALAGCVSVLPDPKPADIVYRLDTANSPVQPAENAKIFRVDRPTAPSSLIRDEIVVSPDGRTLAVVQNANWSQSIPDLVQNSLMKELATRQDIIGVLPTSGARTSHRVHLTIQNFEANFDNGTENAPIAIVQYLATVSDAGTRNLLGTLAVMKSER